MPSSLPDVATGMRRAGVTGTTTSNARGPDPGVFCTTVLYLHYRATRHAKHKETAVQMADMILVSIDDHMVEPPDMCQRHVPATWRARNEAAGIGAL